MVQHRCVDDMSLHVFVSALMNRCMHMYESEAYVNMSGKYTTVMYVYESDAYVLRPAKKLEISTVFNGCLYQFTTGTPSERLPFILQVAVSMSSKVNRPMYDITVTCTVCRKSGVMCICLHVCTYMYVYVYSYVSARHTFTRIFTHAR
jgi:hypothetical protein